LLVQFSVVAVLVFCYYVLLHWTILLFILYCNSLCCRIYLEVTGVQHWSRLY